MDRIKTTDTAIAAVIRSAKMFDEGTKIKGTYLVKCVGGDGTTRWEDTVNNVVTDVGARKMLDMMFQAGSPDLSNANHYLGLISSVGYTTGPAAADTMASHGGWYEAGDGTNKPQWSTPTSNARAKVEWNAASSRSKTMSAYASFTIATDGGTIKGCFIATGGAIAAHADTDGVLYSAGAFSGGEKSVGVGDTVQVLYTTTLSA